MSKLAETHFVSQHMVYAQERSKCGRAERTVRCSRLKGGVHVHLYICSPVSFKAATSLWTSQGALSTAVKGVLRSPALLGFVSVSPAT